MAEGMALRREAARGIRKLDLPNAWDVILLALEAGTDRGISTEAGSDLSDADQGPDRPIANEGGGSPGRT